MTTDVIKNLIGSLDADIKKSRAALRDVDYGIDKLFGNTYRSSGPRNGQEYTYGDSHFGGKWGRRRRLDDYDTAWDQRGGGRRLQSRFVSQGKSWDEVIAEQTSDKTGRVRNKRMFGALRGTLQRFRQDETQLKNKEDKRAQIEAKLDEAARKERDERQQLIKERKLRITEMKRREIKKNRLADLAAWEGKTKYLANFIRTEAKPHIFYLPTKLNPIMECRLEQSKHYVTELIANKRKLVLEDLEDFEQRSKRYWERRLDGRETRRADPMDEEIEEELMEIMKKDDLVGEDEDDS